MRRLVALVAMGALIVGVIAGSVWLREDDAPETSVAILEAGASPRSGPQSEAMDVVADRTGARPVLPTLLPDDEYRLIEVGTVRMEAEASGPAAVYFRYERAGSEPSSFWVIQDAPNTVPMPSPLSEVETRVAGARIWMMVRADGASIGPEFPLWFLAKTGSYDRFVSFEGPRRPDVARARDVIESMLRQDPPGSAVPPTPAGGKVPVRPSAAPVTPPSQKGYGDEVPLGATPVTSCPLTPAGCAAASSLLATVEAGDYGAIQPRVPITYPIGGKPGLDIVDAAGLTRALDQARQELDSIAVGCPQRNELGPEAGACDDLFVLALPVTLAVTRAGERTALGFMFIREGERFVLHSVVIDPGANFTRGGGASGFPLPLDVTGGKSSLWYIPWHR